MKGMLKKSRVGKKGAIMELSMVLMTLLCCFLVIAAHYQAKINLTSSMVSPVSVLKLSSEAHNFEYHEFLNLKASYCGNSGIEKMKQDFCAKFNAMNSDFLTKGSKPDIGRTDISSANFCETVYEFNKEGEDVFVKRSGVFKEADIKPYNDKGRNKFGMRLEFFLEKEYLLTTEDC